MDRSVQIGTFSNGFPSLKHWGYIFNNEKPSLKIQSLRTDSFKKLYIYICVWGLNNTSGLLMSPMIAVSFASKPERFMKVYWAANPVKEVFYPIIILYLLTDHYKVLLGPNISTYTWSDHMQRNAEMEDKY